MFGWLSELKLYKNKEDGLAQMIRNNNYNMTESDLIKIKQKLSKVFLPHVKDGMKRCNYRKSQFIETHTKFLQNDFKIDLSMTETNEEGSKNVLRSVTRERTKSLSYAESLARGK